jgi:hypothetical protein
VIEPDIKDNNNNRAGDDEFDWPEGETIFPGVPDTTPAPPIPSTPQTMTTLTKRPRVVSSELSTPTRAPKAKRVGVRTRAQQALNAEEEE